MSKKSFNSLSGLNNLKKKISKSENDDLINELKELWKITETSLIGKVVVNRKKEGKFLFVNVETTNGKRVKYPNNEDVVLTVPKNLEVKPNRKYKFSFNISKLKQRTQFKQPHLIIIDHLQNLEMVKDEFYSVKGKSFINNLIKKEEATYLRSSSIAGKLSRSLDSLLNEINKKPDTFVFELIQNADDYPNANKDNTEVNFTITKDHLVFSHNGVEFSKENVIAISDIGSDDKKNKEDKIGFKGMGFKSIFKFSNHVWIKSGIFSFKFDENYYGREEFLNGEKNLNYCSHSMPWQVLPIWNSPMFDLLELKEQNLLKSPVCIFIRPNGLDTLDRIAKLLDIEKMFLETFKNEDRILLFLRNVKKLEFYGKKSNFTTILNKEKWSVSKLKKLEIPTEIRERINLQSKSDVRIPKKYGIISSTEITFATKKDNTEIEKTDDAKIFAYLPTDWNLGFNFLVNGNFIPDGSREELFDDIEWNLYLMEEAGRLFIQWISSMVTELGNSSPYKILPDLNSIISHENNDKKLKFLERFKVGMQNGILETPFVLDSNEKLSLLDKIIIDKTGVSNIIGESVFKKQFKITKKILQKDIENKSWFVKHLEGKNGGIFAWDTLKENIADLTSILKDPNTNVKFINFLIEAERMDYFKDVEFVLTANGDLERPSNVYINVSEDDLSFVSKLDIQQLNAKVKEGLTEFTYEKHFENYKGSQFIKDKIIDEIDCINEMVTTIEESKELFNHLFKYFNDFDSNDFNSLKSLNIYNQEQESNRIKDEDFYIYNQTLQKLIDDNCFPYNHFQVVSNQYPEATYTLLQKLNVRMYQPVEFIQHEICQYVDKINEHLNPLDDDIKLKATQHLIELIITHKLEFSENVTKYIFNSYKELKVVTKDNEFSPVSRCFLSNEYTGNKEIEDLMEDFPEKSISFISPTYLKLSIDKKEWKKTLQALKCSDDHLSFIKKELLPSLHLLDENQIINATKLIFRHQNRLEKELASLNYFPVLTNSSIIDIYEDQVYLGKEYYLDLDSDIENLIKNCLSDNIISNKYTLKEYKDWKKFWILIRACDEQKNYEIIEDCFKYLIDNDNTIDIKFDSILSWMKAHPKLSESHLPRYIQKNLVTPNLNNKFCYSGQLFINSLKDVIDDNERVCAIDLNDYSEVQESLSLLTELDIDTCIKILNRQKTITWLNDNKIIHRIDTLLTEEHETFPEDFIANGKVMNQKKEWVLISELFCIEEDFNENLGIKTSKHIIHKDFNKLSSELGIVELTEEDFEFNPIGAEQNIHLKNTLLERMKYISFIKDTELYDELEDDLKEKIKPIAFKKCKKISLQFEEIKKNDFPFWADEDEVILYYIGNWKEFSAAKMFEWIFNYLELSGDGIKRAFERILLAHDHIEIVEYLEENGYNIPEEWKIKEGLKEDEVEETAEEQEVEATAEEPEAEETAEKPEAEETPVEEASLAEDEYDKTISDEEAEAFKMLFGNEVPQECFKDLNLAACVSALIEMNKLGYDVTEAEQSLSDTNEYAQIEPVIFDGDPFKLMCRSAKGGILYLRASSWNRLDQDDINLYVKTGKGEGQYNLFKNKNDVLEVSDTNYQVFRVEADSDSGNTDNIIKGKFDNDKIWMILKMKERQEYKPIFEGSDYNENNPLW